VGTCKAEISRGANGSNVKKLGNGGMLNHLERIHPIIFNAMGKARNVSEASEKDKRDETVRGTKLLFNLRTKQSRKDFLDQVISNCQFF
jgi:hypothetical protein